MVIIMKKVLSLILVSVLLCGLFAGCQNSSESETSSSAEASSSGSSYPLTIENNGVTTTYTEAPERVVVVEYPAAEIMTALGLEDKIVAVAPSMNSIDEVMEEYRDTIAELPTFPENSLTNGTPNLEAVLSMEPDFVYGTSYSFDASACGSLEDYAANDIATYASEGTYVEEPTMDNLYNDIMNIGKIFDVQDRAEQLVSEIQEREQAVADAVEGASEVPVFVFDYDMGQGVLLTTGGPTLEDYMIQLSKGTNIFGDLGTQYANVSVEEIIAKNPEWIIVTNYYTADDGQNKVDYMKSLPELAEVPAVANDNFLILSGLAVWPSLQSIDALEAIAQSLHPECFNN